MKKLAILTTHPIQYNAPWFKLLAESKSIRPKVFYTWEQTGEGATFDPGFGRDITWDIPLLEGYEYVFIKNTAKDPGTHHFRGMINPSLNREIEAWQPDALLVFGWSFYSHLRCLLHFHGKVPILFRGDSTMLKEQSALKKRIRKLFLGWVYRHIDFALSVGTHNSDYFLNCGLREDQLVLVPHAVDNERFSIPDEVYHRQAMEKRRELGIGEHDLVLLFAGKLLALKNPFFMLKLAAAIPDNRLKIIIVGNGSEEAGLKQAAGSDKRIIFLDFQNQQQMPVVYRLGDIFVLPSNGAVGETWGLAINEAMASGSAVIVSEKAGGAIDLVREGVNGMIIRDDQTADCIDFLKLALSDRDMVAAMKKSSLDLISRFSFYNNRTILENFLDRK